MRAVRRQYLILNGRPGTKGRSGRGGHGEEGGRGRGGLVTKSYVRWGTDRGDPHLPSLEAASSAEGEGGR